VSSPSDHQPPAEPERRGPSTQEIPVAAAGPQQGAPLPPHPGAVAPPPVPMGQPQPTSPVEFVPGPAGTPPVPPTAPPTQPAAPPAAGPVWPDTLESDLLESGEHGRREKPRRVGAPRDRTAMLGLGLAVLALVLLELGLAMRFGTESYWSAVPLWSAFATVCAALGVLAFAASVTGRAPTGGAWRIGAGALVGLAVFWVLVVLSVVATDRGFLLTAALGALGGALWAGSGRKP
jgi:hypothetical protein